MSDLLRKPQRINYLGVNCTSPVDDPSLLAQGKYPIGTNVRAYGLSPIETRPGLTLRWTATALAPVHSMVRLSDPLLGVNPLVAGAFTYLVIGAPPTFSNADSGYSGNPLSFVQYQPDQSPSPWIYVGDSSRMRKTDSQGFSYPIGIAPPTAEPTAALGVLATKDVDTFQATTNWTADNTIIDNTGIATGARINTTVSGAIGDVAGGGAGWYTIYPATIADILPGTFVSFGTTGGSNKAVQTVRAPAFTTTVGSIIYDSGSTGLCSIQPAAAVYLDQDCIVYLNGSEYVHVQSVSYAPDGTVQSFRCSTVGTIAATQTLVGQPAFRCYCDAAPTGTITRSYLRFKFLTAASGGVGYISKTTGLANADLSVIGARQVGPDDTMACAFRMNNLDELIEMKLYANVDASDTTGTQNAYMWTVRPADIQKIITDQQTVIAAQNTQLTNTAIGSVVGTGTSNTPSGGTAYSGGMTMSQTGKLDNPIDQQPFVGNLAAPDTTNDPTGTSIGGGGAGGTGSVPQATLGTLGNAQWIQIQLKFSDAVRIGSAAGRTLQSVTAIRISVTVSAVVNTDTIDFDAWWIGGTYGPDVGDIGSPYVYRVRGMDSRTGALSNPGPSMRLGGGVYPRRQSVTVSFPDLATVADASWAQCNQVLIERYGGSLTDWRWMGAVVNDPATPGTLTFSDIYPDEWAASRPILPTNLDQPFVTVGKPLTGTCNVAGTTVTRASGDTFPLTLATGNVIQIGVGTSAVNYVTHARPSTTSKLELELSGGTQSAVTWTIYAPRLIGQPLPALWGPLDNFMLACGDNTNPGRLYWSNGNNPDAHDQASYIDVTPPSEPLQHGCMWDGKAFVWSTDRKFAVYPTFEGAIVTGTQILGGTTQLLSPFRAIPIPNSKGLYARWAFAVGDTHMYQLERDGISQDSGGPSESITDADLYQWFPHDGQPGKTVNGYPPPDLTYTHASTRPKDFRLAWGGDMLYFDYRNTEGVLRTAIYDCQRKAWMQDAYGRTVVCHYYDQGTKDAQTTYVGSASYHLYLGGTASNGTDGAVFEQVGTDDDGVAIACQVRTPSWDGDEPWLDKQWEDCILDCDRGGQTLTVTPGVNNYLTTIAATTINSGAGRQQYVIGGANTLGRNFALNIAWSGAGPAIYIWEPALLLHSYLQSNWSTVVQSEDSWGFGHLRDGYIAYLSNSVVTLTVNIDGIDYSYNLPSTGGAYQKPYLIFLPIKGKLRKYSLSSTSGWRFFPRDSKLHFKQWGETDAYRTLEFPFSSTGRG